VNRRIYRLVEIEEALVPAFLIEKHTDGQFTIFVSSSPMPMPGAIYILQPERVHPVWCADAEGDGLPDEVDCRTREIRRTSIAREQPEKKKPLMCSMGSRDHFLHDLAACRLQWSHAAPGQEPHAFVLVAAVNNVNAIACDRVMECGAGVFGNESEESLAPWIIGVTEQLSPKLL
jgi:hypothetical protein